jgi:hypothetical protein
MIKNIVAIHLHMTKISFLNKLFWAKNQLKTSRQMAGCIST